MTVTGISPGYTGQIHIALETWGYLELGIGARFCGLRLAVIAADNPADVDVYRGIWGLGKRDATTNGEAERPA